VLTSTIPPRELALSGDLVPLLGGARAPPEISCRRLGELAPLLGDLVTPLGGAHAAGVGVLVGAQQSSGAVGRARRHQVWQWTTPA
jgi:hypothetical protein